MNFETLDWELEALHVARAFGIEEECVFRFNRVFDKEMIHEHDERRFLAKNEQRRPEHNFVITIVYTEEERYYSIHSRKKERSNQFSDFEIAHVYMSWEGILQYGTLSTTPFMAESLARVLLHLKLLTPEVETALSVSISQHQKLEWTLEYEARYGI